MSIINIKNCSGIAECDLGRSKIPKKLCYSSTEIKLIFWALLLFWMGSFGLVVSGHPYLERAVDAGLGGPGPRPLTKCRNNHLRDSPECLISSSASLQNFGDIFSATWNKQVCHGYLCFMFMSCSRLPVSLTLCIVPKRCLATSFGYVTKTIHSGCWPRAPRLYAKPSVDMTFNRG